MNASTFHSLYRSVTSVTLLLVLSLVAIPAHASITGTMTLAGQQGYNLPAGEDLSTATSLDFKTNIIGATSAAFGVNIGTTGSVLDLTFDPFSGPLGGFITIGDWSFDLESVVIETPRSTQLLFLTGTGTLTDIVGSLGSTSATWSLSTADVDDYSMTITAIPVPAAIWLFGSGLLGLAAAVRGKISSH